MGTRMASDSPNLGEQALNKVAEVGLSSQLTEVEKMDVSIKTDPFKLMQGSVDSVTVEGEGLVMQKDLRVEKMEIEIGQLSINPLSAALGKIELTRPTDATARILLTESDINRSFNSEFILGKLQNLRVEVDGKLTTLDTKKVEASLPGNESIAMRSTIFIHESNETREVAFSAKLARSADGNRIELQDVHYDQEQDPGFSPELTAALLDKANELGNISNFELEGMRLKLQELKVETGQLSLICDVHAEQFPS